MWCQLRQVALSAVVLAGLAAQAARAAEPVTIGSVGQASANLWPELIALDQGFFAAEGLQVDIVYVQSSAALVQQIAAGSLGIATQTGLADPLRAVGMGAPIAVVRIDVQAPPYDLVAKPGITNMKELKGKVISLGGPKDITRIYVERMLAPSGVYPGDFDMVFAGATTARASALLAGAVDAAILLPPFNFQAEAKGFNSLGLTVDYVKDLPFSGTAVNTAWANANKATLEKLLRVKNKSIAWFDDEQNRAGRAAHPKIRLELERRRRLQGLQVLPRRAFLRADRQGFASKTQCARQGDGEPWRSARRAGRRQAHFAGRDADDGLRRAVMWKPVLMGVVLAAAVALTPPLHAGAADIVSVGSVDATSANLWPLHIAAKNGYFDAANIKIDLVFAQSNASVIQQLAAGSYAVAPSAGMVDPIRAIDKGAPVALVRIVIQSPPYALLAKPEIKRIEDLKGKTIIIGGAKDITRIFTERMLEPHGLKTGDYDYVFAGATSARFSALKSGAVDAALLTVPFNFYAETAGYTNLGFTFDYLPDMPFAGMAVNRDWAAANGDVLKRFLDCYNKGVAWFDDPANHDAAVKLQMDVSKIGQDDVEKAYSFLHDKNLFEPTGKVSKRKIDNVIDALHVLGDLPAGFTVDRLLLPGVTQISD